MANVPFYEKPWILVVPAVVMINLLTIIPTIYGWYVSFFDWSLYKPPTFIGLENFYSLIFQDSRFHEALLNTLVMAGGALILEFILGLSTALLLNRDKKGFGLVRVLVILPLIISPAIIGLMWRTMTDVYYGLFNYFLSFIKLGPVLWLANTAEARTAIILADAWQNTPFVTIVLLAGLRSLPHEPFEAAEVDGASKLQQFKELTLPMLKPIMTVAVIIRALGAIQLMVVPFLLTMGGPSYTTESISQYGYTLAFSYAKVGAAAAMTQLVFIIILVGSLLLIRASGVFKR